MLLLLRLGWTLCFLNFHPIYLFHIRTRATNLGRRLPVIPSYWLFGHFYLSCERYHTCRLVWKMLRVVSSGSSLLPFFPKFWYFRPVVWQPACWHNLVGSFTRSLGKSWGPMRMWKRTSRRWRPPCVHRNFGLLWWSTLPIEFQSRQVLRNPPNAVTVFPLHVSYLIWIVAPQNLKTWMKTISRIIASVSLDAPFITFNWNRREIL